MTNISHNFWEFSLRVYKDPEVAQSCLSLQNRHGLDVNMLLFCCWYGTAYGKIPVPLLTQAYHHSTDWRRHVVQPLRSTRTWMKNTGKPGPGTESEFEVLRAQIKSVELSAEKMQQQALERMVQELPRINSTEDAKRAIQENLESLLKLNATPQDRELTQLLTLLITQSLVSADY